MFLALPFLGNAFFGFRRAGTGGVGAPVMDFRLFFFIMFTKSILTRTLVLVNS